MAIKFKMPTVTAKASLKFKHPVDAFHLEHYIRESLGWHAAIVSIDVKYVILDKEQSDALYDLCKREIYGEEDTAQAIQRLRLESQKRMQLALKGIVE